MFCTNCGKQIADDSAYCEFCGTKMSKAGQREAKESLEEEKVETLKKKDSPGDNEKISNAELQQMADHLEFLGYSTKKLDVGEEREWVVAKHPTNNSLVFFELLPNFILFRASFSTGKKHSSEMDVAVNEANKSLNLAKFYYEVEDDGLVSVKFESIYIGDYSKGVFARFHDFFDREVGRLGQSEHFQAFMND